MAEWTWTWFEDAVLELDDQYLTGQLTLAEYQKLSRQLIQEAEQQDYQQREDTLF